MRFIRILFLPAFCLLCMGQLWPATIRILATGDMHGSCDPSYSDGYTLGGAAEMLSYWQRIEGYQPEDFLLVSCGDNATDPALEQYFNGLPVIDVMNDMGYDLSAVGNHDWDYGGKALRGMAARANFPFVASNLYNLDNTRVDFIAPYLLYEEQGVKVGIIGLGFKSLVDGVKNKDSVNTIRTTYALLRSLGAEAIIVVAHQTEITLSDIAPQVADLQIPLMIGGHSHAFLTSWVGNTLIVVNGSHWYDYSRIDLDYDPITGQTTVLSCKQVAPKQLNPPFSYELKDLIEWWREQVYHTYKVDNADFADITILGNWANQTTFPGYYGTDYLDDSTGYKGSDSVRFDAVVDDDDKYDLFLRWPGEMSTAAANVPVDVLHAGGTSTVTVNEQLNGGQWRKLGTYHFMPGAPASVVVRNANTTGLVAADAVRLLKVNTAPVAYDSAVTAIQSFTPITGTLAAGDPDGFPLQYAITSQPANGTVTLPNPYDGTFVYTPNPDFIGTDAFTFQVNDGITYSNIATVTGTITAPAFSLAISGAPMPFMERQPITFTAVPSDGQPAEFRYQIGWISDSGAIQWEPLTGYTTDPYTWTPSEGGDVYRLRVVARHPGSPNEYEAIGTYDFAVQDTELTGVTVTVSDNPTELVPLTFSASPQGTAPSIEYQFQIGAGEAPATWMMLGPYSTTPACTWTPTAGGSYTVRVSAREVGCPFAYQVMTTQTFTVQAVELTGVTMDISTPRIEGTPITFTATPQGMTIGVEYQFKIVYKNESDADVCVGLTPYSTTPSYTWTPPDGGKYYARVYAQKSGAGSYVNTPTTSFDVADLELTGLSVAISATQAIGPFTFNATATGTAPRVEYQFWVELPNTTWILLGPYSETSSAIWMPTVAGTHYVRVYAREVGNASAYQLSYKKSFTVAADNPPTADPQIVEVMEDNALPILLTGSDLDGDPLTYTVVAGPGHGALSGTAPNLTYLPAPNYHGPDSFTFTVNDGVLDSTPATISITVISVLDPPTVFSPNGGERWARGSSQQITWEFSPAIANVKIELYNGTNRASTMATSTANTGSYTWAIPSGLAPSTNYRVKITSTTDSTVTDSSDSAFAVFIPPVLSTVSPVTASTAGGTAITLSGSAFGATRGTGRVTFGGVEATSYTSWTDTKIVCVAPPHAAGAVDVAVTTNAGDTVTKASALTYIAAPVVLAPNGGERFRRGSKMTISWTYPDSINPVKIDLYNSTTRTNEITKNTANTGSYTWTIPAGQAASATYRVKITSTTNAVVTDWSDAYFTIYIQPVLSTISPTTASSAGGTVMTLNGTAFGTTRGTGRVTFGGVEAIGYTSWTDTKIVCIAPPQAAGPVDVAVTNTAGDTAMKANGVTYIASPIVLAPNGGERFQRGTKITITWTYPESSGLVKIDLYNGTARTNEITKGTANTGSYTWTIPAGQAASTNYRVKITSTTSAVASDWSDAYFTIYN